MFIAILEDTEVSLAAVTFDISCAVTHCGNINDITVHCRVNQCDVCVFLSVYRDSNDMTFDVDILTSLFLTLTLHR